VAKAMELFVSHGFEATTIEQIAAEVGMSSRSVFRYFPTKEDIVLGNLLQRGRDLAEALEARPIEEPPWVALRNALDTPIQAIHIDRDSVLRTAHMLATTPSLRAARLDKHTQWIPFLAPNIALRLSGPEACRNLQAHAIVSSALSCLDAAVSEWTRGGGQASLEELLDAAITAVRG
jgi:AcrR family transcriptional regulator